MLILGIDPGLDTGYCLIDTGRMELILADLGDPRKTLCMWMPDKVVIEKPVVYPHAKENPNTLITLAIQVGNYQEYFGHHRVTLVEARTWKGQLPKSVTEQRVRAKFSNAGYYLDKFPKSTRHNVSDAVGLAWWLACRLSHDASTKTT